MGNNSIADTDAGVAGYNPTTGAADGQNAGIAATQSTLGAVAVGGNGEYRQITGVAAGTQDADAVNVAQLQSLETHVNNEDAALAAQGLDFSGNQGDAVHRDLGQSLAITGEASAGGTYSGTNLRTVTDPTSGAIQLQMTSAPQFGDVVINEGDSGRISGVADGQDGDDAVNLSQLEDIESVAGTGWNLSAQDSAATAIAPDGNVNLRNEDGNLSVSQATNNGREEVTFDLANDITIGDTLTINNGPTFNDNGIDMNGDTITNLGDPVNEGDAVNKSYVDEAGDALAGQGMNFTGNQGGEVHRDLGQSLAITGEASAGGTYSGANLRTVTDPTSGAIQLQMTSAPQFGDVVINEGDSGRISGVADGQDSDDAVNLSQLNEVDAAAEAGWNLSTQDSAATEIAPEDNVNLRNEDGNLSVSQATNNGREEVTFDLANDITIGDSLTINNGPTLNDNGIDMAGDSITDLGDPVNEGDAVNLEYFEQNQAHYFSVSDGGQQGDNYENDGATGVNALAAGVGAGAEGDEGTALGLETSATTDGSVALGSGSIADRAPVQGEGSIEGEPIITYNTTDKDLLGAVSVGNSDAYRQVTNVGDGEQAQDAVTISQLRGVVGSLSVENTGDPNTIKYFHASSERPDSIAGGVDSIAVGPDTIVNGDSGLAMGLNAQVGQLAPGGAAIGNQAEVQNADGIAVGTEAVSEAEQGIALGAGATVSHDQAVSLGSNSVTREAVATTGTSIAGQSYSFAGIAPQSTVSVGDTGSERTITNVAAGRVSEDSTDAINGSQLHATNQSVENVDQRVTNVSEDVDQLGDQSVTYDTSSDGSIDHGSITLEGDEGTTITNLADGSVSEDSTDAVNGGQLWEVQEQVTNISEEGSKYFKANSQAAAADPQGQESVAIGPQSVAEGDQSVATGDGAVARSEGGVALGAGSEATREGMDGAEEAFSNESVASTQGAVSVGSAGGERQITNVAGGTQATDAVNVRQLESVQAGSVNYDRREDGSVDYSSVTLGSEDTATQIHNVAPGEAPTDAANVGQLQELNQSFNEQIGSMKGRIDDVEDDANAGTASALAAASVPQAYLPGRSMFSAGAGTYSGESAVAVGVSRLSDNGRWAMKLNATGDSQGNFGAGVGAGFHW